MSESRAESTIAAAIAARPTQEHTVPAAAATIDVARGLPIPLDLEGGSDE